MIDIFAVGVYTNKVSSSINVTKPLIRAPLLLLLQIFCMECVDIFRQMIEYSAGGNSLAIVENIDQAINLTFNLIPLKLFPRPVVMHNVYYIVAFLGGQAKKHAK